MAALIEKFFPSPKSPTGCPAFAVVENAYDFKSFLDEYLNTDISGHTGMLAGANTGGPRFFQFSLLEDGNVGMVYAEFAGEKPRVLRGAVDPDCKDPNSLGEPWRVFKKLPPIGALIPTCKEEPSVPQTLSRDKEKLGKWLHQAAALVGSSDETVARKASAWFDTVIANHNLGVSEGPASLGVGTAGSLYSPIFGRDALVRQVRDECMRFDPATLVPPSATASAAAAAHAFLPPPAAPTIIYGKRPAPFTRADAKSADSKSPSSADLPLHSSSGSAPDGKRAVSDASAADSSKGGIEPFLKRQKRGDAVERKRARRGDSMEMDSGSAFTDFHVGDRVIVFHSDPQSSAMMFRADILSTDEASKTYKVHLVELAKDIEYVLPRHVFSAKSGLPAV